MLELRITVGKSVLFYSTIYILCRVAAGGGGGGEGGDDRLGESEAVRVDVPRVLGADFKFVNGRLVDRGWEPVNAPRPSLCGTPLLRIARYTRGRPHFLEGIRSDSIRRW